MRSRLLFALAFVMLVGALLVVRQYGYLGGRQLGGPLELTLADAARAVERGRTARFRVSGSLAVPAVQVQQVRPRAISPELEMVETVGGRLLEGSELETAVVPMLITLRAPRAGLHYAVGLILDYRDGQRRFRDREAATLCISVHTRQRCDLRYKGPGDARVAQVGGPSRYPGAKFTETEARFGEPGDHHVRVTLSNRTRTAIAVTGLALDDNEQGIELTASEPEAFRLAPHAYRTVRLRVRFPACPERTARFERLRADLDGEPRSIPLSLPLAFGCAR